MGVSLASTRTNSASAWEAGQGKLSQRPASRASGQRMTGDSECLLWHQQDNPASRGAKWPSDQAIPGLSPWLAAGALMAQLSKLLSACQAPFPILPANSQHQGSITPRGQRHFCFYQKEIGKTLLWWV